MWNPWNITGPNLSICTERYLLITQRPDALTKRWNSPLWMGACMWYDREWMRACSVRIFEFWGSMKVPMLKREMNRFLFVFGQAKWVTVNDYLICYRLREWWIPPFPWRRVTTQERILPPARTVLTSQIGTGHPQAGETTEDFQVKGRFFFKAKDW